MKEQIPHQISNSLEESFEPEVEKLREWLDGVEKYLDVKRDQLNQITEEINTVLALIHKLEVGESLLGWAEKDTSIRELHESLTQLQKSLHTFYDQIADVNREKENVIRAFRKKWLGRLNS